MWYKYQGSKIKEMNTKLRERSERQIQNFHENLGATNIHENSNFPWISMTIQIFQEFPWRFSDFLLVLLTFLSQQNSLK